MRTTFLVKQKGAAVDIQVQYMKPGMFIVGNQNVYLVVSNVKTSDRTAPPYYDDYLMTYLVNGAVKQSYYPASKNFTVLTGTGFF